MKRICILFIFLSAFSGLVAQPSNKDGEESENQYNFCVLYLDYNQDQASKATSSQIRWHYVSNESPYKLSVTSGGVSRDYTYKGARNLAFYNELIKADEEKVYQPLLQVALGKPGRKLIVIFGDGSGNYRGIAQEIGESVLPIDTLRVLNLSKQSVAAMVGEERSQVGPMKSVNFSVSGSTRRFRLPLAMAVNKDGRIKIIEKRKMAFAQGTRKMLILFPDRRRPGDLSYTTLGVVDLPPVDYYEEEFDAIDLTDE